jgi:TolB-like protein/tetratricopeptide (TPR) repeat protein
MSFYNELKRRNVIRVAAGYIVLAWLVVQVVETIFPAFGFGDEAIRLVVVGFAIGSIPVVVLAWVLEWTPGGIRKDEGAVSSGPANVAMAKRWDRIVMVILAIAVTYFIVENYLERPIDVEPTVAVIPFVGAGLDTELAFLSTSVPEGVHRSLARVPELVVSTWATASELSDDGLDAREIAEKLKAPSVLEGTLQATGANVRFDVRLTETKSGRAIWRESYEGTIADVFSIQDQITVGVLTGLHVRSTGLIPRVQRTNPETYRLTQQAWTIVNRESGPGNFGTLAREILEDALALDPHYIPALNALSYAAFNQTRDGTISKADGEAIYAYIQERVLASDPDDGVANVWLAWELFWEQKEPAHANQHLQIALRTGLNHQETLRMMAGFARRTGHVEAAVRFGERALAVDPTCENCMWQHSENLFYAGRFEEAIREKKRLQGIVRGGYYNHAVMLLKRGEPQEALEVVAEPARREQSPGILAMAYHVLGDEEGFTKAMAILEKLEGDHPHSTLAEVYTFTGDTDLAFESLEQSIEQGEQLQYNLFLPQWDGLRNDPRWTNLRERLDMADQQISALDFSPILRDVPRF